MAGLRRLLRDDSMSVALFSLFAVCVAGQSVAGWLAYNESLSAAGRATLSWVRYLGTGDFLDGMFSNWQAAVLQLAVLVSFSSVLRQRGAAHSKPPDTLGGGDGDVRTLGVNFRPARGPGDWLYAHSLSLAFFALFAATFAAHAVFGRMSYDEQQALRGQAGVSLGAYVASAEFVRTLMQTWEAEFFAIGAYIVASIFLRQESSPESKPVGASNDETGKADA